MSDNIIAGVGRQLNDRVIARIGEDAYNVLSDADKAAVSECLVLIAEIGLLEAAGVDCSVARAAVEAAMGNIEMAGEIRAAGLTRSIIVEVVEITLGGLGAFVRGLLLP